MVLNRIIFFLTICNAFIVPAVSHAGIMEPALPGSVVPDRIELQSGSEAPGWLSIWKKARSTAREGDFAEAVREYQRLISRKADIGEAYWELAKIRVVQGNYNMAADLLEDILPEYEQRLEVLIVMAQVQEKLGHRERAIRFYKKVLNIEKGNKYALSGMYRCLIAEKKDRNALPYLKKLYEMCDQDRKVAGILAGFYFDLGFYKKALSVLRPLISSKSATSKELLLAAKSEVFLGNRHEASVYWKKLLKLDGLNKEARRWLAGYYEEEQNWLAALGHLLALYDILPEDKSLFLRIARCYLRLNEPENGLEFVKLYLNHRPHSKEALRFLVNINASLGREDQTLAALNRYFAVEPEPPPEKLRQAARLYDARGRYEEAIPLYKKLIKNNPDDSRLLKTLAEDLLAIGEDEGALHILNQLATISFDRGIYQAMADLLEKLGRHDELITVLERLHIKNPDNPETVLKLISLYIKKNDKKRARALYREIADKLLASPGLLRKRGRFALILGLQRHGLQDYSRFLEMQYDREVCFSCTMLAGRLGLVSQLKRYTALYLRKSTGLSIGDRHTVDRDLLKDQVLREIGAIDYLGLAEAWREAFLHDTSRAMYQFIIDKPGVSRNVRFRAFCGLAELYGQEERAYKTEEAYRMAMAVSGNSYQVMGRLVETCLKTGNFEKAATWLSLMSYVDRGEASRWYSSFLAVKLGIARGSFHDAVARGEVLVKKIVEESGPVSRYGIEGKDNRDLQLLGRLKKLLAVAYIYLKDFEQAEKLIAELESTEPLSLLSDTLKMIMVKERGGEYSEAFNSLMSEADYDLGLLDNLHNILISLKGFGFGRLQNDFADRVRHAILHKNKENLGAAVLLCRSSMAKQEHKKALVLCREFLRRFPGSTHMQSLAALLYYRLHMEDQALSYCNKVLDENNQRAEMLLLKARIVWRSDREKGLAIIKNYLKESAEELVKAAAAEKGLSLPSRPEKSFWKKYRDRIIRPEESRKTYLDTIMAPDFLIGSEREDIFPVVYQYYSRYRWQQQFTEEAYARQAVMRGRYFRAAYHFSNLLAYQKSTDTSLLFDLAQVYGKLRRLEDEALFYKQIKRIDPDFPGLSEQIKRNQLQLSPRFALTYRYRQEEGWDGYKAMKRNEGEASSRFVFSPREQLEISAADIRYDPVGEEGDSLSAKRLFLSSKGSFFSKAAFKLGAGVEFLNHDNSSTGLLLCQIDRKFADDFVVGLSYERDVVTDTYASLTRNVVADNCRASISWDIYPFFSAGGDYGLISYSDSNEVDEYSFWTKYHVFGKPSYLTLTYQYSFRDAEEPEIKSGPMLPDGFRVDDHPYWAPQDYWENSFSLNWQQSISRFFMEHDSPSYYCASYTIDYDERGQVRQTVEGGIYLEWGHHLIGRSSIKYSASENYDVREFLLKAIYRW